MATEFLLLSPFLAVSIFAVIAIVFDAIDEKRTDFGFSFAFAGISLAGIFAVFNLVNKPEFSISQYSEFFTAGTVAFSNMAYYFDILFCIGALFTMSISRSYLKAENQETTEFYNLILYALSGMMLISHSAHLLTLFIGIEIMSITFYIMAGYFRFNVRSVEAAVKYFLLGSFASGFLLYGMSMVYGSTGSMNLTEITMSIVNGSADSFYMTLGLGLLLVGLSFKIAAFPFHQWAPDVYTGSPTNVTTFMSTAGKAAALVAFIIIARHFYFVSAVPENTYFNDTLRLLVAIISAGTMLVGNITAVVQTDIKRMLSYSSVAHAGYMLMGIVAANTIGTEGMLYYITAYLFMQVGAFALVAYFEKNKEQNLELSDYNGLYHSNPAMAAMMTIFMLALAGIPFFAGFYGKYLLFTGAIQSGFTWLAIVAAVASMISMFFYIGVILNMYFKEPGENNMTGNSPATRLVIVICTIVVFVLGIYPGFLSSILKNIV